MKIFKFKVFFPDTGNMIRRTIKAKSLEEAIGRYKTSLPKGIANKINIENVTYKQVK